MRSSLSCLIAFTVGLVVAGCDRGGTPASSTDAPAESTGPVAAPPPAPQPTEIPAAATGAPTVDPSKVLRVCADPHSLPSSSIDAAGYENKIAELFAGSLGRTVAYEWFPQRMGFIRNTLRNNDTPDGRYKCDLVMGVPDNFELAATTRPYLRSVWALAFVKGRGLDDVKTPADLANLPPERRAKLRIGLFDRSPAAQWVLENGLIDQMIPYQIMTGDPTQYAGQIIEQDLMDGKIDATFVWGPIAGYFAKQLANKAEIVVIPMPLDGPIKFDFQLAMAVRFGEKEWLDTVNDLIERHRADIDKILDDFGTPRLPLVQTARRDDDDD
jgi:quinoprotein dehydrogenase-associated probable ABC transporter substrate-binding protein